MSSITVAGVAVEGVEKDGAKGSFTVYTERVIRRPNFVPKLPELPARIKGRSER